MNVWVVVANQLDVGQAIQQAFKGDPGFQPGQVKTQTGVLTGGEGDVRHVLAEDVEFLGTFPAPLVAIGRAYAHTDHRALRNRDPFELGLVGRVPLHSGQRGFKAQPFLDRLWDQLTIGLQRRELFGVCQQQVQQVPEDR